MLRITILQGHPATLKVEGKLANEWVNELQRIWTELGPPSSLTVDLNEVSFVDDAGRQLLAKMYAEGASLTGSGPLIEALIADIRRPSRRLRKALSSVLGLLFLLLCSVIASAQANTTEVLTLEHAVAIAIANNRQIRVAELETKRSGLALETTKLRRLPTFSTELYGSGLLAPISFEFEKGALGNFPATGPIPDKNTKITTDPTFNLFATAKAEQPLSQLYRIGLGIRVSQISLEMDRERLRLQRLEITNKVRASYYEILRLESSLSASQTAIEAYRELDRLLVRYVAEQTALRSDSLDVKSRLVAEQQKALSLRHALESQKEQMNLLLARDLATDFSVEPVPAAESIELELPSARARAISQRPEAKQAELAVRQSEYARRIKKSEYIPDIGAYASYISPFNINFVPKNIATAGLQLTWEPFDFGRRRREVQEQELQTEQAEQKLHEVRAQITADVGMRFRKLEETGLQLEATRWAQQAAEEKVRVVTAKFSEKAALLKEVLELQSGLAQANSNHAAALLSFWTAKADLAKAMGEE